MCVSVELESDLFRNTSVCLCGCLSTFTSYKKRRLKEAARKRKRQHICILHAPTFLGSLVTIQTVQTNLRYQTDTEQREQRGGFLQAKGC